MPLDGTLTDLKYVLRTLRHRPALVVSVISVLALAIASVTVTYSLVDWTVLRPLPYSHSEQIYLVGFPDAKHGDQRPRASLRDFDTLRRSTNEFELLTVSRWNSFTMTGTDVPAERLDGDIVSSSFSRLFGMTLLFGRTFTPRDALPSSPPVAVISSAVWQRSFRGATDAIGRKIILNLHSYTIIGVTSPSFHDPEEYRRHIAVDVWVPLIASELSNALRVYYIQASIKPRVRVSQLRAHLSAIRFSPTRPAATLIQLHQYLCGPLEHGLGLLLGAVCLILLIACANVAGILHIRGLSLRRDLSIRAALGASRSRLLSLFLGESLLLAVAAGGVGIGLASISLHYLKAVLISSQLYGVSEIHLDARIILFILPLVVITAILCGLWPGVSSSYGSAIQAAHGNLGSISRSRGTIRAGSILIVIQVALSLVLLSGAGLLIKSLWLLTNVQPGFSATNILTMKIRLPASKYHTASQRSLFYSRAIDRLSVIPGISYVAMVASLPLSESSFSTAFIVQGHRVATADNRPTSEWNLISPRYFTVLSIPLIDGRFPESADMQDSKNVVFINHDLAQHYWPGQSAVGKHISFGSQEKPGPWLTVAGVVGDVKATGLGEPNEPQMYQLYPALPPPFGCFLIRAKGPMRQLGITVRKAVGAIDRDVPVYQIEPMAEVMAQSEATPRFRTLLLSIFGCLALIVTALGIYGVISYSVTRRTRDIGIRMALGASNARIFMSTIGNAAQLTAIGIGSGLIGALAFMRTLRGLVFAVHTLDPSVLFGAIIALFAVSILAAAIPASRAAEVEPARALRYE